jgi:DNA invertase Pin-like site-specific DNA recombinase
LARNSVDGGRIIYLVDTGKIQSLKFPAFWFEPTPQGKFMLNIAFGQSKYYVDNLSENVKRGLRQKLRRGEWPGQAPIGYVNNLKNHTIEIDKERVSKIRKLFNAYASDKYTLKELSDLSLSLGLVSQKKGKVCR